MNTQNNSPRLLGTLFSIMMSIVMMTAAHAGPGHDHAETTTQVKDHNALPTLTAVSELYEVVGTTHASRMTLHLDKTDTNEPVTDAQIEVDFDGTSVKATQAEGGTFVVVVPPGFGSKARTTPVAVTVLSSAGNDLLAGEYIQEPDVHGYFSSMLGIASIVLVLILLTSGAWVVKRKYPEKLNDFKMRFAGIIRSIKK